MKFSIDNLPKIRGNYRFNFPLNKSNWFKVGGEAEVLVKPEDEDDLSAFLKQVKESPELSKESIIVLGVGSNLIIRDGGIRGFVIKLGRNFNKVFLKEDTLVSAGASVLDINLAEFALASELEGLEFFVGIPGTVGGAIAMNAGCYGSETGQVLERAYGVDYFGEKHIFARKELSLSYRHNPLANRVIFTGAEFRLRKGNESEIRARMEEIQVKREESQPLKTHTSGSTFKNPEGYKAWELIDKAGMRGYRIGDAMMSEKHCNFMINVGNATAHDLEILGEEVRDRVRRNSGIELEWEVKIIGERNS